MIEGPDGDRPMAGRMPTGRPPMARPRTARPAAAQPPTARRVVPRRPFSITGIVMAVFLAVLGVAVFAAVYRPFAVALAGAAALVSLTWLLDRRANGRR
ncbi:MAG: hypothetical protein ACRDGL_03080 [Candidatus Limnocylindrales bacterium]